MKTIYLQRQGSTDTFNTLNAINTDLGYYIEVKTWSDNRHNIIIASTRKQTEDETKNKRIEITAVYPSLSDAFRRVEKELREELSEDAPRTSSWKITISARSPRGSSPSWPISNTNA